MHKIDNREYVLDQIKEFVSFKVSERQSLLAVFLVGSIARADSKWVDVTDIDIVFVDSDPSPYPEPCIWWQESLLIDMHYSKPDDYDDKMSIRTDASCSQDLYDAVPLYDTKNYFALLQAYVRGQFDTAENVHARAADALRRAYLHYENIVKCLDNPVPIPIDPLLVKSLHKSVEWIIVAVLTLSYKPKYGRRSVLAFNDSLVSNDASDVIQLFEKTMGFQNINEVDIDGLRQIWLKCFRAAGIFHEGNWRIDSCVHPFKEDYYLEGFKSLAEEGHSRESLLLMEYTFASAFNQIITFAPAEDAIKYIVNYKHWMQITGKGNDTQFVECIDNLTALLHKVEAMTNGFAEEGGVV